jgi:hypothetical protein
MMPPLVGLLDLTLEFIVVFFKVNYDKGHIIFTIVVGAALKSDLLSDFL